MWGEKKWVWKKIHKKSKKNKKRKKENVNLTSTINKNEKKCHVKMYRQEKCNEKKGDSLNWFVLLDTLPITVGMLYISTLVDLLLTHLKTFLKFATATRASSFIISEFLNGQITSNLLCLKLATSRYQK